MLHLNQLMSHPVSTVQMEMDILTARRYFQQQGFQQMPVINAQQRLVGMLSIENLLQFIIIDEQDALIGIVSRSDILRTLTIDPPLTLWT